MAGFRNTFVDDDGLDLAHDNRGSRIHVEMELA